MFYPYNLNSRQFDNILMLSVSRTVCANDNIRVRTLKCDLLKELVIFQNGNYNQHKDDTVIFYKT